MSDVKPQRVRQNRRATGGVSVAVSVPAAPAAVSNNGGKRKAQQSDSKQPRKKANTNPYPLNSMAYMEHQHAMRRAKDLAYVLATLTEPEKVSVPAQYNPGGSSKPTAAIKNKHIIKLTNEELAGGLRVWNFKRPGVAMILGHTVAVGKTWQYDFLAYPVPNGPTGRPALSQSWLFSPTDVGREFDFRFGLLKSASVTDPTKWAKHGDDYVGQTSKFYPNKSILWLDAGEKVTWSWENSDVAVGASLICHQYRYGSKIEQRLASEAIFPVTGDPGEYTFTCTSQGYYWFSFQSVGGDVKLYNMKVKMTGAQTASTKCHRHLCINKYCANLNRIQRCRVISSTSKVANATPSLNLGGTSVSANFSEARYWYDYDSYDLIASVKDRETLLADKGLNGQLRPGANVSDEMQMRTYSAVDVDGTVLYVSDDLEQDAPFYGMAFNLPDSQQTVEVTMTNAFEFETEDDFTPTKIPRIDPEVWTIAFNELKDIPQFTENPSHLEIIGRNIAKSVKKAVGGTIKVTGQIMKGAKYASDIANAVAPFLV